MEEFVFVLIIIVIAVGAAVILILGYLSLRLLICQPRKPAVRNLAIPRRRTTTTSGESIEISTFQTLPPYRAQEVEEVPAPPLPIVDHGAIEAGAMIPINDNNDIQPVNESEEIRIQTEDNVMGDTENTTVGNLEENVIIHVHPPPPAYASPLLNIEPPQNIPQSSHTAENLTTPSHERDANPDDEVEITIPRPSHDGSIYGTLPRRTTKQSMYMKSIGRSPSKDLIHETSEDVEKTMANEQAGTKLDMIDQAIKYIHKKQDLLQQQQQPLPIPPAPNSLSRHVVLQMTPQPSQHNSTPSSPIVLPSNIFSSPSNSSQPPNTSPSRPHLQIGNSSAPSPQISASNLPIAQTTDQVTSPELQLSALKAFVITQYRNFELLEQDLFHPRVLLQANLIYPLSSRTRRYLINSYYSFDEKVMKELLGKKLNTRTKKELEDISEKTGVPLGGCRRMFENLKRIMKKVQDFDFVPGIFASSIFSEDFLLTKEQARSYTIIIFICTYRLDTSKKKLSHLKFYHFCEIAATLIQYFTSPSSNAPKIIHRPSVSSNAGQTFATNPIISNLISQNSYGGGTTGSISSPTTLDSPASFTGNNNLSSFTANRELEVGDEIDPQISQDSRDIRSILFTNKEITEEFKNIVSRLLNRNSLTGSTSYSEQIATNLNLEKLNDKPFRIILKNALSIGASTSSKEFRDIYVNLVEKVIEQCESVGWGKKELELFLDGCVDGWMEMESVGLAVKRRYERSFGRVLKGVKIAAGILFDV
ncbi:hypothetical protein HK098_006453 [Nowakowskiella sp. JEL0407]|nr:hypothetical protein HK098_006453 [Nowakowskiella sp. JEL0407]